MKSNLKSLICVVLASCFLLAPNVFAAKKKCKKGHKAKVEWKGYYYQATLTKNETKKEKKICVHYDGWPKKWDKCVSKKRVKCKYDVKTVFKVGKGVLLLRKNETDVYDAAKITKISGNKYSAKTTSGATRSKIGPGFLRQVASLSLLLDNKRLNSPVLFSRAHKLIRKKPLEKRAKLYRKLQKKVPFANQCDNKVSYEVKSGTTCRSGGSCVLTAVSMAVRYLGLQIPNRSYLKNLDYEDTLDSYLRTDKKLGASLDAKLDSACSTKCLKYCQYTKYWRDKLNKHVDDRLQYKRIASNVKQDHAWWKNEVGRKHLDKGHGVVISADRHVFRLQAITTNGLVTDDPYGKTNLSNPNKRTTDIKNALKRSDSGYNNGEDHVLPWAHVKNFNIKYVDAFYMD